MEDRWRDARRAERRAPPCSPTVRSAGSVSSRTPCASGLASHETAVVAEIGLRGSPSRRFLRRGGVPIPPVTAALGPLPPRGERLRRRPASGPPRQDRTWANGAGEAWAVSRARTRAAARRSAGRQGRACRSLAACVRSQTPRDHRAGCRTTPDTHPGVEQGAHRYVTGSDAAAAALWSAASSAARCRERLLSIAVRRR